MMLAVKGLTGGYGETTVLWDVSFEIARGQAVALLGRNGMGKTTTLLAIMGLIPPRGGSVRFKDRELIGLTPFAIARLGIGYAPEGRQLFAPLTVVQNLRIPFVNKHPDRRQWPASSSACSRSFPGSPSGSVRRRAASPAASSRCSPSPAPSSGATSS